MKTIKINEEAWSILQEYKLITKAKNMSEAIKLLATTMYYYNEVLLKHENLTMEQWRTWLRGTELYDKSKK